MRLRVAIASLAASIISSCATHSPIAKVPINIVDGNPIATADVGGAEFDLIIDTGGFGGLAISSDDLGRLNVDFSETWIERTDAAGDSFLSREFVARKLLLGGNQFSSVKGFERLSSTSGFAGGKPINVLGREFLHEFIVVIDYPNERIELYDASLGSSICGADSTDLRQNEDGHIVLDIQTDGGEMLALMDTGATFSFVQSKVVKSRTLAIVEDLYTSRTLEIGGRDFGPLDMVALTIDGAPDIDVFIGANFFSEHKVCFDFGNFAVSILD